MRALAERISPSPTMLAPPGTGVLHVTRVGPRTVVSRAFARSPLKLLTPGNAGHAAWVYCSTYGGGLVDGDQVSLAIDVGPESAVLVSTQASTKVYRSPRGTGSQLSARVAAGGLLVVMPEPVVCFAGATYRQFQEFDLEAGAGLVLVDWLTSGRRAVGERWEFDRYESRVVIRDRGRPIVYDSLGLQSADGDIGARLGRFNVVALVAVIGSPLVRHAASIVARTAVLPVRRRPEQLQAASPLGDDGCLFRVAGVSVEEVSRTIRDQLAFLPSVLGDDPWTRKW